MDLDDFEAIPKSDIDQFGHFFVKLGTLNLQNKGNANQDKKQGQAGYDFPQGTTFIRKPEKLIMEGIMWYTKGQSEHERLIHLLWTIFPGKRKEDQEWRLHDA